MITLQRTCDGNYVIKTIFCLEVLAYWKYWMALGLPAILVILENLSSAIFVPQRPSPLLSVLYPSETGIVPAVVLSFVVL